MEVRVGAVPRYGAKGDARCGTDFIYHNGAKSHYAARGFRCILRV